MQSGVKPVWHHPPKELHLLSGLVFMVTLAQKLNRFLHAEKNSEIASSDGFG
jgi:hypothetical protein